MKKQVIFKNIPQTFQKEVEVLSRNGILSWDALLTITEKEINQLMKGEIISLKNIRRLKCIAIFICDLQLDLHEAALLMQCGLSSINSLAGLTPQELVQRSGRLERSLRTGREPILNLKKAFLWIKKAKESIQK